MDACISAEVGKDGGRFPCGSHKMLRGGSGVPEFTFTLSAQKGLLRTMLLRSPCGQARYQNAWHKVVCIM